MEVFGVIWLIALTVGVPIAAMKYKYRKEQLELERDKLHSASGMTLGELKATLREVVEEANGPLVERIEALERLVAPPAGSFDPYEPEEERAAPRALGRRLHT